MADGASLHDRAVLRTHAATLHAFGDAATRVCQGALGNLEKAAAEVQRSLSRWQAKVAEGRRDAAEAQRALTACRADREADCGQEEDDLEEALARLATAEENLATARRCHSQLQAAGSRLRHDTSVFRRQAEDRVGAGAAFLRGLASAADAYAGSSVGGAGSSGGGGASAGGSGSNDLPRIGETELVEAPLDRLDTSKSGVTGPESFSKTDYARMRQGVQRLDEVVLDAVRNGADGEHFARMDAQRGLDYEGGYQRVYEAFFGGDSLRLDHRSDGTYEVIDGLHRIHVARELGLSSLPARIAPRRRP